MIVLTNHEGGVGIDTTARDLAAGVGALDAVEAGVRMVEDDPSIRSVGYNSWPNILGQVELDAAVMDGATLRSGAIGGLIGFKNPVSVARAVMERLPHEILVGVGAARFASEIGAETAENLSEASRDTWQRGLKEWLSPRERQAFPDIALTALCQRATDPEYQKDTTVFLAIDGAGDMASAVSTSGWAWKYPGRLGDSPIIGAGSYADGAYGACACTHTGEMTIRAATSRSVVLYLKMGLTLEDALYEAGRDLKRLRGGLLRGVAIHAIDAKGAHRVASFGEAKGVEYWVWEDGMTHPERRVAIHLDV
ncbi:N(4)-(beta-N-acetylglucosaminyl)-L-asparaginase [Devosia algicola]|uniref:N(4)-(Beta-N-acetylglucosaminyl)-L-asparaginase n=1 Tax=Devosia algicola TaxID=3026418 RepID=A0ABY7YQP9_9HYPH|nr:N(4)-(beta-N-acetylglucosaminyl)-L-asparaginase [Devosia algicola]WDR03522.1 N(4)-(beta-N-acetylglucosaminyl)-L-asparaginase [Devosia algicola]